MDLRALAFVPDTPVAASERNAEVLRAVTDGDARAGRPLFLTEGRLLVNDNGDVLADLEETLRPGFACTRFYATENHAVLTAPRAVVAYRLGADGLAECYRDTANVFGAQFGFVEHGGRLVGHQDGVGLVRVEAGLPVLRADRDQLMAAAEYGPLPGALVLLYEKKIVTLGLGDAGPAWERTLEIDDTLQNFGASLAVLRNGGADYVLAATREGLCAYKAAVDDAGALTLASLHACVSLDPVPPQLRRGLVGFHLLPDARVLLVYDKRLVQLARIALEDYAFTLEPLGGAAAELQQHLRHDDVLCVVGGAIYTAGYTCIELC